MLFNSQFVNCDTEQGDWLLKLVEFVRLVIIWTLLPHSGQLTDRDRDFKVPAEPIVALKSKHNQVFSYLTEVAFLVSILPTVKIEHLE